jgi:hypothetical protein
MQSILSRLVVASWIACSPQGIALAQSPAIDTLIDATMPERIVEVAKGFGSAELSKDGDGDPLISGRIEGKKYQISFFGCSGGSKCHDIRLLTGWSKTKVGLEQTNEWNRTKRFGTAFLDNEGDPILTMTVNLEHGVSRSNLDDTFVYWGIAVRAFEKEVASR